MKKRDGKKKKVVIIIAVFLTIVVLAVVLTYVTNKKESQILGSPGDTCSICLYGPDHVWEECGGILNFFTKKQCEINAKDRFKKRCIELVGTGNTYSVDELTSGQAIQTYCSVQPCNTIKVIAIHHGSKTSSQTFANAYVETTKKLCACNKNINVDIESQACYSANLFAWQQALADLNNENFASTCSFHFIGSQTRSTGINGEACSSPAGESYLPTPTRYEYITGRKIFTFPECKYYVDVHTGVGEECYSYPEEKLLLTGDSFICKHIENGVYYAVGLSCNSNKDDPNYGHWYMYDWHILE